jgi:hypothetical protein
MDSVEQRGELSEGASARRRGQWESNDPLAVDPKRRAFGARAEQFDADGREG